MFLEIVTRLKNISQSDFASAIFVRTFNQLEIKSDNFSKKCKWLSEFAEFYKTIHSEYVSTVLPNKNGILSWADVQEFVSLQSEDQIYIVLRWKH